MINWWTGPDPTRPVTKEEPVKPPVDLRRAMLRWFAFAHLKEDSQKASKPFADLAAWMLMTLPPGPQANVAMQRLLEAKDAAVRAALDAPVKIEEPKPEEKPASKE